MTIAHSPIASRRAPVRTKSLENHEDHPMSARRLVAGLLLRLACVALSGADVIAEGAADWPNKTVRVIVNYGPGGTADNSMRPFAHRLSARLGHQFVIENRGGASGALGVEVAMKSAPD